MVINAQTKIAALLRHHPGALEAIVSLSPDFKKLRNPVLRKLMAGRTSIAMAARIGHCKPEDFFSKLKPLGFEADTSVAEKAPNKKSWPSFLQSVKQEQITTLDVRPLLEEGKDPLNLILQTIKALPPGQVLKIINTFEPTPLMNVLKKQGFESYADPLNSQLVETYFFKKQTTAPAEVEAGTDAALDWEHTLRRFEGKLQTIDVRALEMPLPMMQILEALEQLPQGFALYVYHKRIPVFLLTELKERQWDCRIKEISDSEVHLIIFKS